MARPIIDMLCERISGLPCDDQYALAMKVAANVGYKLVPEDSIQAAEDHGDVLARLSRLEDAVKSLVPGWR